MTDRQATEALARLRTAMPWVKWRAEQLDVDCFVIRGDACWDAGLSLTVSAAGWHATAHYMGVTCHSTHSDPGEAALAARRSLARNLREAAACDLDTAAVLWRRP
jgi:hypothetical protein